MPDAPNPYQSPEEITAANSPDMSFGAAIRRGFVAAHAAPAGAVWMFFMLAPVQIGGAAMNTLLFGSDLFEQLQSGEFDNGGQPPPELLMMAGGGCLMCMWLPVLFFTMPWIWGGAAGQIRDRIVGQDRESFSTHGRRTYSTMLLLMLLFVGGAFVANFPTGVVQQIVSTSEMQPGDPISADKMQQLARHPANIAANIVSGLLMTALGTLANLAISAIVARRRGLGDGLSQAFSFCGKHTGAACKLFLIYVLMTFPFMVLQWLPQLLPPGMVLAVIVGSVSGVFLGYLTIVNLGLAGSLFDALADGDQPSPEAVGTG